MFAKNSFDGIPISGATCLKSESCSLECSLEMLGTIDEKHGIFDVMSLLEFAEEHLGERGRCGRKQPDVKQLIRLGTGSGVQPILLIVDANHGLVEIDMIRVLPRFGL